MKRTKLNQVDINRIVNKVLSESNQKKEIKEVKPRCIPENVVPLSEIVGEADDFVHYGSGIEKRGRGVNSFVDTLGILNNIRWAKDIKDGGAHLAYDMMNHLNRFRNKNYYDEATGECHKAMDKVIELYKENEHGTELVKDIERVLALQTKDDHRTPSARTKEFLKQCINLVKGK